MKRFLTDKLIEWKNSKYRKPLILRGARQVGKTYILKDFAIMTIWLILTLIMIQV